MSIKDEYDFEYLVNEAERLVLEQLEVQLKKAKESQEICTCQDCILDMAAFALNNVKPLYRVSLIGTLYAHALDGSEYVDEVSKAVGQAIKKISTNPAH